MLHPLTRERLENWIGDFAHSDTASRFPASVQDRMSALLNTFITAACEHRDVEPEDLEEVDLKHSCLHHVARLDLAEHEINAWPKLASAFLEDLEASGRLSHGRRLGLFVGALGAPFSRAAKGEVETLKRPGEKVGRNDFCPCGSGKKYKKCCMNLL